MVKNDRGVGVFDLHGFEKATPSVRQYFVALAYGGSLAEVSVLDLFEDDAWLRRSDELRQTLGSEIDYVMELAPYVWEAGCCAAQLHLETVEFLQTASSYLYYDFPQSCRRVRCVSLRTTLGEPLTTWRSWIMPLYVSSIHFEVMSGVV